MTHTEDLTKDLQRMMHLAADEDHDLEPFLNFGLEWILRLAPVDLVTVLLLESEHLVVRAAKGSLADDRVRRHAVALSKFPSIQEALNACGPRVFEEHDHADGEGDLFDGVLDLPHGHACMVIPLCHGVQPQGILAFDRAQCGTYDKHTVQLLEIFAQILAMALYQAEQSQLLRTLVQQARERERLLVEDAGGDDWLTPKASKSAAMRMLAHRIEQVAATPTPVLIRGETGTGKEGVAALIHAAGERRRQPLIKINCAAIPENLLESEMFGVVRGAFTGAVKDRPGRFRMANGGTLFLDEIGEMPLSLQAKLLRVLQEGTFEPVGGDRTIKVDVRVVAATNVDLLKAIEAKTFREDLYYRLNVFPIELPPLRERLDDLPSLCETLLRRLSKRLGKGRLYLADDVLAQLVRYPWPGNIRELGNVLERAVILAQGQVITCKDLDLSARTAGLTKSPSPAVAVAPAPDYIGGAMTLDEVQRRHIIAILEQVDGKIYGGGGAAELLAMKPSTLQSRMKKLGIERRVQFSS
ncbi:sigma 54-interacting transcriptional regulator [Acanthopleuribacter pedis]|uniref:Sigma 54-interacting transcriptional regulator n=1 Tax=Acanthopleuribacter pedis TaxID=442870 RepID=A0A8J7QNK7_9BACT|nr:sigma 54-interacting transcriptional regulator [Acanthopleuribacter pedis]MBO1321728.1 sigma 54-interacting transcriptional regulator [Acanthopleuribacter pedis]